VPADTPVLDKVAARLVVLLALFVEVPVTSPVTKIVSFFVKSTTDADPSSILVNNLPSYVLTANSPNDRFPVVGIDPVLLDLFKIIVFAILCLSHFNMFRLQFAGRRL